MKNQFKFFSVVSKLIDFVQREREKKMETLCSSYHIANKHFVKQILFYFFFDYKFHKRFLPKSIRISYRIHQCSFYFIFIYLFASISSSCHKYERRRHTLDDITPLIEIINQAENVKQCKTKSSALTYLLLLWN